MPSPCLTCDDRDKSKNSKKCINCELRIRYATEQGMLPNEIVKKQEEDYSVSLVKEVKDTLKALTPEKEKTKKPCNTPGCEGLVYAKSRCKKCYNEAYRNRKKKKVQEILSAKKEKEKQKCNEPGCDDDVKARGKCQNHYRAFIRAYPGVVNHYRRDPKRKRNQINLYFGEKDSEARKIINELEKIAKKELRRTTEQALYFIHQGILQYKSNQQKNNKII